MKKFSKALLIIGVGLFAGGLLLALTSLALGGQPQMVTNRLDQMGVVRPFSVFYHQRHLYGDNFEPESLVIDMPDFEPIDPPAAPNPPEAPDADNNGQVNQPAAGAYEIERLNFNFAAGEVEIIAGDDFGLIYGSDNARRLFYERKNGNTWIIGSNRVNWRWPWDYQFDDARLTVVLPHDFYAESMYIDLGAGSLRAGMLAAQNFQLDVAVGDCQIESLAVDEASLTVGVGHLALGSFHANTAKLDAGLGSVELTLAQPLNQYRCRLEVGLGTVQVGGNSYSGVANVSAGNEDAPYRFEMSCGLGSINVRGIEY